MIFSTSLPRFKAFLGALLRQVLRREQHCLLFLVPFSPSHLPAFRCRCCPIHPRRFSATATWLLRWLGASKAPEAPPHRCSGATPHRRPSLPRTKLHVLVIDSTYHLGQQGKNTQNTIATGNKKKRPTQSNRKQKQHHRHSGHCFVFALLLTPNGIRIPYWLPYFTEPHCKIFGRQHLSQASLAAQLIDNLPLPRKGSRVVVVGDTPPSRPSKSARRVPAAVGSGTWCRSTPSECCEGQGALLVRRVRSLYWANQQQRGFAKVSFRLDQGDLAAMARVSPSLRSQAKKHRNAPIGCIIRTAAVHNVGEVALLFSRQTQPTPGDGHGAEGAHQQRGGGNHGGVASLVLFEMANRAIFSRR